MDFGNLALAIFKNYKNSQFHRTVPQDDHLQEASPYFDNLEKDMKNVFLRLFTMR